MSDVIFTLLARKDTRERIERAFEVYTQHATPGLYPLIVTALDASGKAHNSSVDAIYEVISCGNGKCEEGENCGIFPSCGDADCDPACTCLPKGESCVSNEDCCFGRCQSKKGICL